MKLLLKLLAFVSVTLWILSCDSNEPQTNSTLSLNVEDVSCTEVWLQLKTTNLSLPNNITLFVNDLEYKNYVINNADTLLYIDSLLPNKNYTFKTISFYNPEDGVNSNKVNTTTLDTTSHNFTWQSFEFGQHSSSELSDISIIDENNIWTVGRTYMNDSLGNPDLISYNAIHWNGSDWKTKKINVLFRGNTITPPLEGVFTFSNTNIWFVGSLPINGDGINWTIYDLRTTVDPNLSLSKVWSLNSNNIYFFGRNGNIARCTSGNWQKIVSGTELYLSDMTGNNKGEIYVIGNKSSLGQGVVLQSSNGVHFSTMTESANIPESQIFKPKLFGSLTSVWVDQSNTIYTAGDLFYRNKFDKWDYVKSFPGNYYGGNQNAATYGYFTGISGNASNDMWIVGERNTVRHFNGVTWQQIGLPYDRMSDIIWLDLDVKDNLVAISGTKGNKAFIMIIKR